MKRAFRDEWSAALRSGDYAQMKGNLTFDGAFCCLGVRCELSGIDCDTETDLNENEAMPMADTLTDWGLPRAEAERLAKLNDDGLSFNKIADELDKFVVED